MNTNRLSRIRRATPGLSLILSFACGESPTDAGSDGASGADTMTSTAATMASTTATDSGSGTDGSTTTGTDTGNTSDTTMATGMDPDTGTDTDPGGDAGLEACVAGDPPFALPAGGTSIASFDTDPGNIGAYVPAEGATTDASIMGAPVTYVADQGQACMGAMVITAPFSVYNADGQGQVNGQLNFDPPVDWTGIGVLHVWIKATSESGDLGHINGFSVGTNMGDPAAPVYFGEFHSASGTTYGEWTEILLDFGALDTPPTPDELASVTQLNIQVLTWNDAPDDPMNPQPPGTAPATPSTTYVVVDDIWGEAPPV